MTQGGEIGSGPVRVRRVALGTGPGQVTVLGQSFVPSWDGVNGRGGFINGSLERRLYEPGRLTITFPNAAGTDGVMHRDRFRVLSDPSYAIGDEWVEVWEDGDLLAVMTPVSATVTRQQIDLSCEDGLAILGLCREGQFGFWAHAPRDAWEHYCRAWRVPQHHDPRSISVTSSDPQLDENFLSMSVPAGLSCSDPDRPWRLSVQVTTNQGVGGGVWAVFLGVGVATYAGSAKASGFAQSGAMVYGQPTPVPDPAGSPTTLTLEWEGRGRYIYLSCSGTLVGVTGMPNGSNAEHATISLSPPGSGNVNATYSWTFHQADRFLCPAGAGDIQLPGAPAGGGVQALFASWQDVIGQANAAGIPAATAVKLAAAPTHETVASRTEGPIDHPSAGSSFAPSSIPPEYWTGRFVGAIYLDLDARDYAVRVRDVDDYAGVWIGRTRLTDLVIYAAGSPATSTSQWLKAGSSAASAPSGSSGPLAGKPSGWYPLVIEYVQYTGSTGLRFEWSNSGAVGTWTAVPATALSEQGILLDQVRNDSHLDTLDRLSGTFGYQFTVAPRSLESGEFPGICVPVARVGKDTDKVLDEGEGFNLQTTLDAASRSVAIQADAQGIADPQSQAQLAAEMIDTAQLDTPHLFAPKDYESLADISNRVLLAQRMASLLALRDGPWTTVSASTPGRRELRDSFPLTGALAELAWSPGDGIRLNLPSVGVVDAAPRQILGVTRDFTPNGLAPPALSFRPRPRNLRDALRRLRRDSLLAKRNYQGSVTTATGSQGATGVYAAAAIDQYSRLALPADMSAITRAVLVVLAKSDASTWTVEINGTAPAGVAQVAAVGRYDITSALVQSAAGAPQAFARLVWGGTGTGAWLIQLELTLRM